MFTDRRCFERMESGLLSMILTPGDSVCWGEHSTRGSKDEISRLTGRVRWD